MQHYPIMKRKLLIGTIVFMGTLLLTSCGQTGNKAAPEEEFTYEVDRFGDISVLRYRLPAFEQLTAAEKEFIYYLSEAALCGRDILWDQNFRYNMAIRKTIEAVIDTYTGDRESADYKAFVTYAKRVFFANGIHHHYSNDKFVPAFSADYFARLVSGSDAARLPLKEGQTAADLTALLTPVLFDPSLYAKKVDQTEGADMITASANNFYEGVTQAEVEKYYASLADPADPRPVSWGLNTKVVRLDGRVTEIPWKSGGMYGQAIDKIVYWLEKARDVALSETQKQELELLIQYYRSGDLKTWDDYNVLWAGNTGLSVDYINGFIETYGDPMGMKATWEAVVDYKDTEASKRTGKITENAQWFEDHSPVDSQYRKEKVTGVAASVINVAMLGGDCYPASPLGINLPNSNWIRAEAGSKSVTLANITDAKDIVARGSGFLQ
ncbi:MAG TPA: dihydrofolate reductase, partial [Bacteroidales bacterium]|nr:dihydrofolate reductase [Bacteroidales bacterium]